MAGVKHTTSADGSFSPAGAAAWQEEHTLSDVASQTDLNALSNALSVLSATNSTEHAGLSNRITSVAGLVGGGGSVTSAEAQAISAAAQSAINTVSAAVDVVSNSLSVETAARIAAVNTVSNSLSVETAARIAGVNTVSNSLSVEIADRISAVNVVSNALSAEIAGRNSAVNAVSNALSVLSNANSASHVSIDGRVTSVANAVSVLSQALSVLSNTNSAAHVSIDGRVTSVANAVSVVSNALSVLSQTNSVDHAALSNRITSVAGLGGGGSVTSAEVNAVSVAAQSAVNTQSARIDTVSNAVSVLSNALSALSQTNSVDHAALSNRITSVAGLAGGGSVTSNEVSIADAALSARIDSAFAGVSNQLSQVSQYASVVSVYADQASNYASVASNAASIAVQAASVASAAAAAAGAPQIRKVANVQSTTGSALVDISGLVLTVAANETWEIQGMMAFSTSATTVGMRLGYSVPPLSTPRFGIFNRASGGQSAGFAGGAGQLQISGQSVFMSITGVGPAGGVYVVDFKHVMNVASAGTVRLMYAGVASTIASPIHIMPGSYLKAIKI